MNRIEKHSSLILIAVMVLIITGQSGCGEKTVDITVQIEKLKSESLMERQAAFIELHAAGTNAIPQLIAAIDDKSTTIICMNDPTSSMVKAGVLNNYSGILSAYMVELILARDKLEVSRSGDSLWVFGGDSKNYIYTNGIIVRENGRDIDYIDVKKIAGIYKTWWEQSKSRSIEGLRDEWHNDVRPLTGSEYHWE